MKGLYKILSCLIIVMALISSKTTAQFEGQIQMNLYSETDNGATETSPVNLFVTADRIMLKGESDIRMNDMMNAEGLLIRHDQKDFVLMMGDNKALQITKAEIESLVQTFSGWSQGGGSSASDDEVNYDYEYTDRTRTINGFNCAELQITSEDEPGKVLSVWLTPDIKINWGILKEPWKNLPKEMEQGVNNLGRDILFSGDNFPMLVEVSGTGDDQVLMEVSNVNESSIAKAMVEIPSGIQLVSMKEFMFNMMMQQ